MEWVFMVEQLPTSFTSSSAMPKRQLKRVAGNNWNTRHAGQSCAANFVATVWGGPFSVLLWFDGIWARTCNLNPIEHLRDELEQQDFSPECCGTSFKNSGSCEKGERLHSQSAVERSGVQILTECPYAFSDSSAEWSQPPYVLRLNPSNWTFLASCGFFRILLSVVIKVLTS